MKLFCTASRKLVFGLFLTFLTSSVFAAGQQCKDYYIQLMVTSSSGKAHGMKLSFNKSGYRTSVMPFKGDAGPLYRVRTGPYSTVNAANQTLQKMKSALPGNKIAQQGIVTAYSAQCRNAASTPIPAPAPALKQQIVVQQQQPVSPPPKKRPAIFLQNTTQCYRNNDPKIVIAIQLSERNGKVNGFYFSRPEGMDGGYGYITGAKVNNSITGKFTYAVEGDTGTENIRYLLEKQALVDGSDRYAQVNCNTVKEEINVAKDVSKQLQSGGQQSAANNSRTGLRFSQFATSESYSGENQPLVMDDFGNRFRTRLRSAIKDQQPTFAGHYLVTGWGCGSSGCNTGAVINAKTGVATPFPVSMASVFPLKREFSNEDGQEHIYKLNSRLMIFAGNLGSDNSDGSDTVEFYEFKNGAFKFLESRPYGRSTSN